MSDIINLPSMVVVRGICFFKGAHLNPTYRTLYTDDTHVNLTERETLGLVRYAMRRAAARKRLEESQRRADFAREAREVAELAFDE